MMCPECGSRFRPDSTPPARFERKRAFTLGAFLVFGYLSVPHRVSHGGGFLGTILVKKWWHALTHHHFDLNGPMLGMIFMLAPLGVFLALASSLFTSDRARSIAFLIADISLVITWLSFQSSSDLGLFAIPLSVLFLTPVLVGGIMASKGVQA